MMNWVKKIERGIVTAVLLMMLAVVLLGTIELGVVLVQQMIKPPVPFLLNITEMLTVFSFFMMVLIGIELLETIKTYMQEHVVHAEIILLVAITAIARKIIILDYAELGGVKIFGIAALMLACCLGYFLIKKGGTVKLR